MDRENAKTYMQSRLQEYMEQVTEKSKYGLYVCPICGSGAGRNGTGAFGIYSDNGTPKWKCQSCQAGGDIFDLVGEVERIADYAQKFKKACDILGVDLDDPKTMRAVEAFRKQEQDEVITDFTAFLLKAHANIDKTDYWAQRGLSRETVNRFKLGYVENWKHPKAESNPHAPATPRLIIPISKYNYLARDVRKDVPESQKGLVKQKAKGKAGVSWIFNRLALAYSEQAIFITEGELDAISIVEVGGEAVATGSVANINQLLSLLKTDNYKPKKPLIIAMDNDDKGQKAAEQLAKGLEALRVPYVINTSLYGDSKDANEALTTNREDFKNAVQVAAMVAETEMADTQADKAADYVASKSALNHIDGLLEKVKDTAANNYTPTGFRGIDDLLDGGLYAGLYVVGAISSLGKTTFCLQVADNIAKSGQDVLIFSLEMAKEELMAKSISRHTLEVATTLYGNKDHAKTTRGILTGKLYAGYGEKDKSVISQAVAQYKNYAGRIFISEGIGNIGVDEVKKAVADHISFTGNKPVVLIDYVQILAAPSTDYRGTDKQKTDENVLELKRLSRDEGIPVIGISSFNRENYTTPVNMTSFKESGALEYGSDVVIGLQLEGMDYREGEADKAREKRIRELRKEAEAMGRAGKAQQIQIKILKNRNGSKGSATLNFYPMFNYFEDVKLETPTTWKELGEVVSMGAM